jgi:hypothetical protein
MIKESVLIDNTINETRQIIKSLIPQIKGKIVKEDSRRIVWTYRFGLDTYRWGYDTIECQTQIATSDNGTIITTTSQNYDLSDTNLKEPITKFHDALKQKFNVKETNDIVEKPKRNKTKPKPKHCTNSHKSILWKLIAIVGIIAFIFYMGSDQQTSEVSNDINYELKEYDIIPNIKYSANIILDRKLTKSELEYIANRIYKEKNIKNYERAFLAYYLPGMKIGSGAWATTHFNPNLEIIILGFNNE